MERTLLEQANDLALELKGKITYVGPSGAAVVDSFGKGYYLQGPTSGSDWRRLNELFLSEIKESPDRLSATGCWIA